MKERLILLLFLLYPLWAKSLNDSTKHQSWWIAYKMGSAQSDVSGFQRWAVIEGVNGVTARSRNTMIGFDLLHNRDRLSYGLSTDFELRTFGQTEPYFFSFAFRAGYQWLNTKRLQLRSLGGIGCGYVFVRFENQIPQSLQSISSNYSDPFARSASLISRWEVMASWNLFKQSNRRFLQFQPLVIFNAGVQPILSHGRWNYGEMVPDIDGSNFVSQRIDMPKFYKANWFVEVGLALSISRNN